MPVSRLVALALNLNKPYDRKIAEGIARYVREQTTWSLYVEDDPAAMLPDLRRWRGDGLIVDVDDPTVAETVQHLTIPTVGIGGAVDAMPAGTAAYVGTDNEAIGRLAAEHLLERGLRHFGFCGVPVRPWNPWSERRQRSFVARLAQAGLACASHVGRTRSPRNWAAVQQGLTEWISSLSLPVGIMACNDARARHVLEACRRLGLRVPDDVAVIGVDNDELMCELSQPQLASVVQGTDHIGFEAAATLDLLMQGQRPRSAFHVVPPAGIAVRGSTDVLHADVPEIASAVRLIRDEISTVTVDAVVKHVGVSRATLDRTFQRHLGHSVHERIHRERLSRTRALIGTTDRPLKEIAAEAGYGSQQYMSAVFRQHFDTTPAAYRRSIRGR